jgi:hypothetical protein
MRIIILFIALMAISCYIEPSPLKQVPESVPVTTQYSYCGDSICDEWRGEDAQWCVDCGYDPLINGPGNGGFCGDGICFNESMWACWQDCRPRASKSDWNPLKSGCVDLPPPPPWEDQIVVKVIRTEKAVAEDIWTIIGPDGPLTSFSMPSGSLREDVEEVAWETVPKPHKVVELVVGDQP